MDQSLQFQDVIKSSFFEMDFTSALSIGEILLVLTLTFLMGLYIFYIYKKTFQGVLYTQSYNISLVMVSLVTSLVIMTISSNFILSLGMVGALSIVRFRTAIKDSMDIVFMFWAISIGIANGAGFFKLSFAGLIVVSIALLILSRFKSRSNPYLLIINYADNNEKNSIEILKHLKKHLQYAVIKSKTLKNGNAELAIEVRLKDDDHQIVEELSQFAHIDDSTLISYNGDYVS
jgi:uncharacterized membrane protein YhiD involved in acid resistance